jgi:hypothetical protein
MAGRAAVRGGRPLLGGGGKRGWRPSTAIVAALLLACAALLLLLVLGALSLPGAYDGAGRVAGLARPQIHLRLVRFFSSFSPVSTPRIFFLLSSSHSSTRISFSPHLLVTYLMLTRRWLLVLQGAGDARGKRGAVDGGVVVGAPRVRVPQLPREYLHRLVCFGLV